MRKKRLIRRSVYIIRALVFILIEAFLPKIKPCKNLNCGGFMVFRRSILFTFLVTALLASPAWSSNDFASGAQSFVQTMAQEAFTSLSGQMEKTEREQRFRKILHRYIAFKGVAKWVLGRTWRKATKEQQDKYLKLFEELMIATYAHRFEDHSGETLDIIKTEVVNKVDALVFSKLSRADAAKPLSVDWRIRASEGNYKIVDILVEGVSMAKTQRAEFASVMRKNGGNIDALLIELQQRLASADRE